MNENFNVENEIKPANGMVGMQYGWICPVCGRGLSPYTSYCNCKKNLKGFNASNKTTYTSTQKGTAVNE